jgi:Tol biopolymer transport system component
MSNIRLTTLRALMLAASLLSVQPYQPAGAQGFGRTKVQYDRFDFRILPTSHFEVYFYPAESLATADAARMAERWYERHSTLLRHNFVGSPLIFYADPPDFQQSNVVEGSIGVGTGGITEGLRERVIMPFTGVYADNDHVLGHELVHVFQYRLAGETQSGLRSLSQIPLWLIEGMAEYLSLGRDDPNTAMWLRDAARRNDLPTIKQLTEDPRYFPYRYGQALWAYIGGRWGDQMINQLYRAALQQGWEASLRSQLGMSADSLSKAWHAEIRQHYAGLLQRVAPDAVGRSVIRMRERGEQNVSPTISPDGRYVSFFSSRNLFGMDLYIAEVATGRVIRQLTNITRNPHFDALSFINSAGSWSPDGQRVAIVAYAEGDQEIDILNARSGRVERRLRVSGITAMADPAWSPDGRQLAFAGLRGGISDLYVHDLNSNATRQLTNDREAQIQPAWSPDGRTLAYATDADPATRFDVLEFQPMRLATIDVASSSVRLLPRFAYGKAINPQFSSDGNSLYFVSDQDGISDIYRMSLANGTMSRVTRTATGISGISGSSPAISVAQKTGDIMFSVFDGGGFNLRVMSSAEAQGEPVQVVAERPMAGVLPPVVQGASDSYVARALDTPELGLPGRIVSTTRPYRSSLSLESVGGAQAGVAVGGGMNAGLAGGIALGFSDMLGDHLLQTVVQASGSARDIGGQAQYINRSRRLNWGVVASHIPYVSAYADYSDAVINSNGQTYQGTVVTQYLQREYFQDVRGILQYPLSTTRRFEFGLGAQRISYGLQVDSLFVVGNSVLGENSRNLPGGDAITFGTANAAFVGDYSFFGFTSPIAGGRYRFEVSPYVGTLDFTSMYADYRRYFFKRPFTLALRGLHFGRYGGDSETRMNPVFVGQPLLIRGYDPQTFDAAECTLREETNDTCPQLSRLSGSRIGVANVELRIPLFGTEQLGIINMPFFPLEIAPFFDAGVAWSSNESPQFRFDQNTADRVPVFSTGVTGRVNLFGYAIIEMFYVRPLQRPGRGAFFGWQIAPGW